VGALAGLLSARVVAGGPALAKKITCPARPTATLEEKTPDYLIQRDTKTHRTCVMELDGNQWTVRENAGRRVGTRSALTISQHGVNHSTDFVRLLFKSGHGQSIGLKTAWDVPSFPDDGDANTGHRRLKGFGKLVGRPANPTLELIGNYILHHSALTTIGVVMLSISDVFRKRATPPKAGAIETPTNAPTTAPTAPHKCLISKEKTRLASPRGFEPLLPP
jgi:hypothetical protein